MRVRTTIIKCIIISGKKERSSWYRI